MAWLGTYAKRTKVTVDNTNIDSDLTQLPVAIVLGTSVGQSSQDLSRVFDEVGSSYLKIAITKSDGTTQIYGDVELWDSANEKAVIHVAKSDLDILSASVTELYIYYDSTQSDNTTYIGIAGEIQDSLLVHSDTSDGSTTFADSSGNNHTITPVGDTHHETDQHKFGATSIYFDGNDYLTIPDSADFYFTGNFTLECWVYVADVTPSAAYVFMCQYGDTTNRMQWGMEPSGVLRFYLVGSDYDSPAHNMTANAWNHVAVVRAGNTLYHFANGILLGTNSFSVTYPDMGAFYLGARMYQVTPGLHLTGYLDEICITKRAKWTATFSAPIVPYVAIVALPVWDSNFKAVYHMAQDPSIGGACIADSTANKHYGTPGGSMTSGDLIDGQIGKAIDFDGSDDYVSIPNTIDFEFGSAAYTISLLINYTSAGAGGYILQFGNHVGGGNFWELAVFSGSVSMNLYDTSGYLYQPSISATMNDGWHHIACVFTGSSAYMVLDGVLGTPVSYSGDNFPDGESLQIGRGQSSGSYQYADTILDEIYISDVALSDAWIKATSYALADNLLTYGSEEIAGLEISADSGAYSITGFDADLISGMGTIDAESGAYVLTGADVNLIGPKFINAGTGAYVLTGSDADLISPKFIEAGPGAYAVTGSDIQFDRIDADTGAYTLTGADVNFKIGLGPRPPGIPVYLFTLTGAPDSTTDIEIPIKSFQARLRSGSPTYLMIVIPGMGHAAQINDRPNGVLEVDIAYLVDDEYTNRETIIQANLEDIRIDQGSFNKSISLAGHKQKTFVKKSITLTGATYKNTLDGNIRYRLAEPNVYLNPGDSVTIDTDTFDANVISYFVSARRTTMELSES